MSESLYFPLVFLAGIVGICTAAVGVVYRDKPGAKPLVVFAAGAGVWTIAEGLQVAQAGLDRMVLVTAIALSLSALLPLAWLLFVIEYTGNERLLTRGLWLVLLVEPIVFWSLVWTNDSHGFVWSGHEIVSYGTFDALALEFELAFLAHQLYSSLLLAGGALLLVRMLLQTNRLYQWQAVALLVAVVVPMATSSLYSVEVLPPGLDPTGISYVLAGVILAVTVLETELLGIAPATRELGREAALTELDDAMIILNDAGRIVDCNPAGQQLLGIKSSESLGRKLESISPELCETVDETADQAQVALERDGKIRYFDIRVSALSGGYGILSGRVLSCRDITEQRQREQRLDVLNRMLRHNVRNELNLVRGNIELAQATQDTDKSTAYLEQATDAVDEIVDRSDKLGRLSRMLDAEDGTTIDIARELRGERETGGLSPAGGTVFLELPETLVVAGGSSLVAVFEELVTNGIEHNDSDEPSVHVSINEKESDDRQVVIEVADNGPGLDQQERQTIRSGEETALTHSSGVGLWLVNWVVERAGGTVDFENEDGCTVKIRLPRGDSIDR